jgi:acyl-CoA reductase-like NAD-dependent aldehyde dehydrogenase
MSHAVATDVQELQVLIGGERRPAGSGETFDAVNPATGTVIARVPRCGVEDVAAAVEAANAAFPAWRSTPATERAARLNELAEAVGRRREELARADTADNGSPYRELLRDADIGAAEIRYFAGLALQTRGETIPTGYGRVNYTLREPFGVVGRIVPFNHPVLFATMKIGAPLAAGNTVILKPSEHTSVATLLLAEEFAGIFPPGVINVVTGYGAEAGDALVVHPLVRRLAFIGLESTGRMIQARAASVGVKTVTLELGGKNPIVVFPDADLDNAIAGVVAGMNFTFQGQSCGSTSRLIVHREIHDEFVERLVAHVSSLRVGPPFDEGTDIGPLINENQLKKVLGYVELGVTEGAELLTGGIRVAETELTGGFFVRPAVFDKVTPKMRLAQEEIFGPVLAVLEFDSYDQALEIANGVRFGLTASIFTNDLRTAHRFARDVEAGFVWINDSARHFLGAPFGGFKDSGVGRDEDIEELLSYTQVKNVNVSLE